MKQPSGVPSPTVTVSVSELIAAGFQGIGVAVTAVVAIAYVRGRFDWDPVAEAESYIREHLG